MVKHPIEYEVLKKFGDPGEAPSIFKDDKLKSTLQPYRDKLERAGLMPDAAVRRDRLMRLLLALMALGVVGVIKIVIGLSLERPVGFLVVMMIAAMIIGAISSFPRLTARGKAALSDITNLYSGLRTQSIHSVRAAHPRNWRCSPRSSESRRLRRLRSDMRELSSLKLQVVLLADHHAVHPIHLHLAALRTEGVVVEAVAVSPRSLPIH